MVPESQKPSTSEFLQRSKLAVSLIFTPSQGNYQNPDTQTLRAENYIPVNLTQNSSVDTEINIFLDY